MTWVLIFAWWAIAAAILVSIGYRWGKRKEALARYAFETLELAVVTNDQSGQIPTKAVLTAIHNSKVVLGYEEEA